MTQPNKVIDGIFEELDKLYPTPTPSELRRFLAESRKNSIITRLPR